MRGTKHNTKGRRKKRIKDKTGVNESWLLPYSDLMTLLLALFIVLFSTNALDASKLEQLSRVFNTLFMGGEGVFEYSPLLERRESPQVDMPQKPMDKDAEVTVYSEDWKELEEIEKKINAYIENNHFQNKFEVSLTSEGLLLRIKDNALFDSGRAMVRKEDMKTAKELAAMLVIDPPRNIIISGHTDNIPIQTSTFQSNWELSVMRAVNFMKVLLQNKQLDPREFSAKGFGEFQPVADNTTAKGRAKNRRVEVLILPFSEKLD